MNKTMKKGIIGLLLIIVFAFIVFAPENVFAEESAECTAAREKFKKQGPKKYGIKNTYDKDKKTYTIEIIKTAEVNKFLTSNGINPVFTITGVYVNGNDAHSYMASSELMLKKTLKPGEKIVISENTLKRMALAYNGKITVVVKLKPDGFEDPDLKAACGEGTNFNYEVSIEYEYCPQKAYAQNHTNNLLCFRFSFKGGVFVFVFFHDC